MTPSPSSGLTEWFNEDENDEITWYVLHTHYISSQAEDLWEILE